MNGFFLKHDNQFFFLFIHIQIGSMLVNRVSNLDLTWRQEMEELSNRASPTLELTLDDLGLRRSIEQMTFLEMKRNLFIFSAEICGFLAGFRQPPADYHLELSITLLS